MASLSKRSTIYFEPSIHQALKLRAASTDSSVSEIVDEAVRLLISDDQQDLAAIAERVEEPEISYEALLNDLKAHGKI
ncbi:MAG: CopG family transcriptional regulator [Idiomarina sp.]|nr:CopG family transcriptional regulator [Idiomarina sp.]